MEQAPWGSDRHFNWEWNSILSMKPEFSLWIP
jgi:hypothetical protein